MIEHRPSSLNAAIDRIEMLEREVEQLNHKLAQYLVHLERLRNTSNTKLGNEP